MTANCSSMSERFWMNASPLVSSWLDRGGASNFRFMSVILGTVRYKVQYYRCRIP